MFCTATLTMSVCPFPKPYPTCLLLVRVMVGRSPSLNALGERQEHTRDTSCLYTACLTALQEDTGPPRGNPHAHRKVPVVIRSWNLLAVRGQCYALHHHAARTNSVSVFIMCNEKHFNSFGAMRSFSWSMIWFSDSLTRQTSTAQSNRRLHNSGKPASS